MDIIQKKQFEQFLITVNFYDRLEVGEYIASFTIIGINSSSGEDSLDKFFYEDTFYQGSDIAYGDERYGNVSYKLLDIFFFEDTVYQEVEVAYGSGRYGGLPDNAVGSIIFGIKDGTIGINYKITVTVTTNLGNIYEEDLILQIKDRYDDDFIKQPSERFTVEMDFAHRLNSSDIRYDDTIQSQTVAAIKTSDGSSATGSIIYANEIDGETKVKVVAQAGVDGEIYQITTKIVTVQGYQYQMDVLLVGKEL